MKKQVKKAAPKRVSFRGKKGAIASGAGRGAGKSGNALAGQYAQSGLFIGKFAVDSVKSYGGGNGAAIFSSPVIVGGLLWVAILFRYVLFYGFFNDV